MALKDLTKDVLKIKLHRTKRVMQVLTWLGIVSVGFLFYGWIMNTDGIDSSFAMLPIALAPVILILDKKYKRLNAELEARK